MKKDWRAGNGPQHWRHPECSDDRVAFSRPSLAAMLGLLHSFVACLLGRCTLAEWSRSFRCDAA
ncbi:hypothetical protein GA0061078_1640 [Bifidobacterium bohemicum]|uniref:Uncharacterized protein n=1 Tax=Bifidobacterium bohemicum DSM 22767 TaxID=1437606 RepID=A0A086ZH49_9BIFI|nr:hypothetical protein [Bifidobacterium bohemicum]KFI45849.1 hypothetical protein BBOH_0653 [Bifidobacterium bohemicum DSM 22767]SCC15499.1 hypothetical protein GA0061078_1640 [Bifidobacterium bohemicum]